MDEMNIPIKGMHCKSCTILIAEELNKISGVTHANVNLNTNQATIKYTNKPSRAELALAVGSAGRDYSLGYDEKPLLTRDKSVYKQLMISAGILAILFVIMGSIGLTKLQFNGLGGNSGVVALVVGLTAGFSTCMALIGGLVLGLSARYAEKHQSATAAQRFRPHLFFNLGRILTFFILGGIAGLFGSIFKLDSTVMGLLTIAVGFVMIILGLQLTELFPKLSNKTVTLPAGLAKALGIKNHGSKEYSHKNAMILGGLTFFLPCGFTQAMQLVAISSGSFVTGSIVMGLFAIGTAPGLLGVGGLTSIIKGSFAKKFFRFAGAAVVLMAIYNISNGYNLTGFKFSFDSSSFFSGGPSNESNASILDDKNAIILKTTFTPSSTSSQDISPNTFNVEVGKSYILSIYATDDGQGCMSTIMIPGVYNTPMLLTKGMLTIPFKINKPGTYNITCAMGIVRGTITATEGGAK